MKKSFYILTIVLLVISCTEKPPVQQDIPVDLDMVTGNIPYSQLVDSLEYATLSTGVSCLMSAEIEQIALDGDTLLIHDRWNGVFVFTRDSGFLCQINPVGSTPETYIEVTSVAFDTGLHRISIFSAPSQQVLSYTYGGDLLETVSSDSLIHRFASAPEGNLLNISYSPYNPIPNGAYYYDYVHDNLYLLTSEKAELLYPFVLKQAIPAELRSQSTPAFADLKGYAYLTNYSLSLSYGLFTYYLFGDDTGLYDDCFRWVLFNRTDNTITAIGNNFINDLDSIQTYDWKLHFINESLWARVLAPESGDCTVTLQLLHLKRPVE